MILEVEQLVDRIMLTLAETLPQAAVQEPADALNDEGIVTTVVPWYADGGLVAIEGVIDLDILARAIVDEIGTPDG